MEQMLQGHRLTLSMDGVGLDVHVKLDRKCHLDEQNGEENVGLRRKPLPLKKNKYI